MRSLPITNKKKWGVRRIGRDGRKEGRKEEGGREEEKREEERKKRKRKGKKDF